MSSSLTESVNTTDTMTAVALAFIISHVANGHIRYNFLDLWFFVLHSSSPFVDFIYKVVRRTS